MAPKQQADEESKKMVGTLDHQETSVTTLTEEGITERPATTTTAANDNRSVVTFDLGYR